MISRIRPWWFFLLLSAAGLQLLPEFSAFQPPVSARRLHSASTLLWADADGTISEAQTMTKRIGDFVEMEGNFVLKPSLEDGPPRALIHFLGGALVGHAPHVSYRYLLERLAAEGYLVVCTPYSLSFDHLVTCDIIIDKFERIAPTLAQTYGALPVVGVGHSCGSLLQLLITSLFPDTPRAANALLSYNNKPVSEAVPLFEELAIPFFNYVAARNDTSRNSGSEVIRVGIELTSAAVQGALPSDELLSRASDVVTPPALKEFMQKNVVIPSMIRNSLATFTEPAKAVFSNAEYLALTVEIIEAFNQIPSLIDEVADGARDFVPPPMEVDSAAERSYRARRTLVLKYESDPLDESDQVEELLKAAGNIIRMKRPMIEIDVQKQTIPGGHAAPLLAPPLELATRAETLLGPDVAKETFKYKEADQTVDRLVEWLEESNL